MLRKITLYQKINYNLIFKFDTEVTEKKFLRISSTDITPHHAARTVLNYKYRAFDIRTMHNTMSVSAMSTKSSEISAIVFGLC